MDLSYLEESLADAYMMQFMAHQFHWNVKGQDFIQYHNFLQELYTEVHEEADAIAEQIRINGKTAPISLISLIEMSNIDEQESVVTTPQQMMTALEDANDEVILSLYGALDIATEANAQGLINFLADRIDAHAKIGWKLSSSQE
jgi:starvation-inducible DNA-binding protein